MRWCEMAPRYKITLTNQQRELLEALTHKGESNAHQFVHAQALLLCDIGLYRGERRKVAEVADILGISVPPTLSINYSPRASKLAPWPAPAAPSVEGHHASPLPSTTHQPHR